MTASEWSPIVYGRTLRADYWWRAVPPDLPHHGWLASVVASAVAGGDRLQDNERFLVARVRGYWVTGVACRSSLLSATMNSDGQRPLFGFVGWSAPDDDPERRPPPLEDLEANWRTWAGELYQEWVGRDWATHPSLLRDPHPSEPVDAPWPAPQGAAATDTTVTSTDGDDHDVDDDSGVDEAGGAGVGVEQTGALDAGDAEIPGTADTQPLVVQGAGGDGSGDNRDGAEADVADLPDAEDVEKPGVKAAETAGLQDADDIGDIGDIETGGTGEPTAAPHPKTTGAESASPRIGRIELYPMVERHEVWAGVLSSPDPFVLVVGWPQRRDARLDGASHLCVGDVAEHMSVPVPDGWIGVPTAVDTAPGGLGGEPDEGDDGDEQTSGGEHEAGQDGKPDGKPGIDANRPRPEAKRPGPLTGIRKWVEGFFFTSTDPQPIRRDAAQERDVEDPARYRPTD